MANGRLLFQALCVCMRACVHVTYMYARTHTHTQTHIHTHGTHTYTHGTHIHVRTHAGRHTHTDTDRHRHTQTDRQTDRHIEKYLVPQSYSMSRICFQQYFGTFTLLIMLTRYLLINLDTTNYTKYDKNKLTKWGIKLFTLSDATNGYVYRLQVCT